MKIFKSLLVASWFVASATSMATPNDQSKGADFCNKISAEDQGQLAIYHASVGSSDNLSALLQDGCFNKIKKDVSAIESAAISVSSIDAFLFFRKNFDINYQRLKVWKKTFGAYILKQSDNPIDIGSDPSLTKLVKSSALAIPQLAQKVVLHQGGRQELMVSFFKEMDSVYLDEKDYNGNSYLHIAFKFGLNDVAEIIAKRAPDLLKARNKDGIPAFFYDKRMAYAKQAGVQPEKKYLIANIMLLSAIQYGVYTKAEFIQRLDKNLVAEQTKELEVVLRNKTAATVLKNASVLDIR